MISTLLVLIGSSLASFVGSLQLGPVNIFVINTTLNGNQKGAFWIAVGGSIPELIYCFIAVFTSSFFLDSAVIQFVFKLVFIVLIAVIGCSFLFKKQHVTPFNRQEAFNSKDKLTHFSKGFSLALFNPQLIPFWIVINVYFNGISFLKVSTLFNQIAFILGAGLGAFILLISIIRLVNNYQQQMLKWIASGYYFKVIGVLFILVALHQLISLLIS